MMALQQLDGGAAADEKNLRSVRARLLDEMQNGAYRYAHRLPRESVLADRLSISRTQLRDSLAQLEREGFITRRHGVGTLINHHVLDVRVRTDIEVEFSDMIRRAGYTPDARLLGAERTVADADTALRLCLPDAAEVLTVTRVVLADGRPAIYCEDSLPVRLLKDDGYPLSALEPPIFEFLKNYCGTEPYMDLTELRPAIADPRLAGLLEVEAGAPLLYMDEVDYDIDGVPVLYARQYYVDGVVKHTLMRKKF